MDNAAATFAKMDAYTLAWHSLKAWNRILNDDPTLPSDVADKIEDILTALEYIEGWEPSDADVMESNPCGTAWHDGCR